jgi:hypothetical protein
MFRAGVELALGVTLPRTIQTRIYALSERDWTQYAQPRAGLSGYFLSHPAASDLMFNVDDVHTGAYELIFHEYVHHILRTSWAGEVPAFLDEGLAEVFSTATFDDGIVLLAPRADYAQYLRRYGWSPLEQLINVRRHDPEYVDHSLAPAFYAQSWATVYYAITRQPSPRADVMTYLREHQHSAHRVSAAERFVGTSLAEANREISLLIRKPQRIPVAQIAVGTLNRSWPVRTLGRNESILSIAELMLRVGNRHQQALELFEEVRHHDPGNLRARVGAAWAHLYASNWTQAAALLDETAAVESVEPASVAVSLGRALYQLVSAATSDTDEPGPEQRRRLVRARDLFAASLRDKSTRVEAISGYVLASLALGESDESLIVLAKIGYRAAPRSSDLAVALAILHELRGKSDAAQTYWRDASRNTHTGPLRARIMKALQSGDSQPIAP